MYKENQNKVFNIIPDGDLIHVFVTAYPKSKKRIEEHLISALHKVNLYIELEYDDAQFYFALDNYEDYQEIKEEFYKTYFGLQSNSFFKEDMYNED